MSGLHGRWVYRSPCVHLIAISAPSQETSEGGTGERVRLRSRPSPIPAATSVCSEVLQVASADKSKQASKHQGAAGRAPSQTPLPGLEPRRPLVPALHPSRAPSCSLRLEAIGPAEVLKREHASWIQLRTEIWARFSWRKRSPHFSGHRHHSGPP